ncbi:NAD(P)H-binding protein [Dactylosporangium sp. NPDC000244]|uniref:SDR family oxidoreductase n=1 Tax=Dactylosporangium sp. NPDC000244 TaxID=3154365 RepID=UPI00332BABB1
MRILVTGGTGNVGRLVVGHLLRAGADVRVLTRRADPALPDGVEVVRGDLAEPGSLRSAFAEVQRVYLFPHPATAEHVVRLAERAGVRRVVTLSSGAVTTGHDTNFHLPVERAVEASGLEWTHVRPGEFMLNALWLWGPSIRAERVVRDPFPDWAGHPVHEHDIADAAAAALLGDGHEHRAYTVNGPEQISRREQVGVIADALGEDLRFEVVTPARAREIYLAQGGFAAASADFLSGFESYSGPGEAPIEAPRTPVRDVTWKAERTFATWARDHLADFR